MPETPEMVERVALAICRKTDDHGCFWHEYVPQARAAIQAMRMTHLPGDDLHIINAKRVWNAGIDAALAAPEEGRD